MSTSMYVCQPEVSNKVGDYEKTEYGEEWQQEVLYKEKGSDKTDGLQTEMLSR